MSRRAAPVALAALTAALVLRAGSESARADAAKPHAARADAGDAGGARNSAKSAVAPPGSGTGAVARGTSSSRRCVPQAPQPFLVRANWFRKDASGDDAQGKADQAAALRYRTERYGYFAPFGSADWNKKRPTDFGADTTFFGLPVRLHAKVVTPLRCVEEALRESGAATLYRPRLLNGFRTRNTFHGGEVSNHVYGIALDIDSDRNPCCGCGGSLRDHPRCKLKVASIYERGTIPKVWIDTFERFGFYWLGADVLADTMHFEFLGDPDLVSSTDAPHH